MYRDWRYDPMPCGDGTEGARLLRGGGTVLVVDDDPAIHVVAERILHELGYEVIGAWDGLEGVETFTVRHRGIDLVLMDLVMPRLSGKDAYQRMRRVDPDVKVIMASGFPNDTRIQEALDLGVQAFVPKPYSLAVLAAAMHELLTEEANG